MKNKLAICAILILLPVILYAQTIRNTRLAQLNQVIYADVMIGADAGAKITNCFAELPATGGTCDARGLEGVQSATTTIAVPDDVTLLLGATALTSSADPCYTLGNHASIIGLGQVKTNLLCSNITGTGIKSSDNTVSHLYSELRGFSLGASGTHTTSRGVDWTGITDGRIQDVRIIDFGTQMFLDAKAGTTGSTQNTILDHVHFQASNASSGSYGLEIRRQANAGRCYSCRFSRLDKQIILGNASESEPPNQWYFSATTMEQADTVALELLRANTVYFVNGRFENNAIAVRTAADVLVRNVVIECAHFVTNTTDIDDSSAGLTIRSCGEGAKFEGQQSGLANEAAPNLLPNALMEGWSGTTDLLGWTSLTTTNWDTTGNETQESTIIQSGSFSVKAGDGTNTSRGVATPSIPIDPSRPYTLKFNWTTPNITNGKMRYGFRLLDSSDVLITTGTVIGISLNATGTGSSTLTHSGSFNAHILGSDQAPIAANTMQLKGHILRFPSGVASVRFGIWASGGAAPDRFVYVDDVYFAEGVAALRGDDRKIGDSGDQTLHGTFKPDAITTGVLNNVRVVDGNKFTTIQAAIDASPSTGGEVYVPRGSFTLTTALIINKPIYLHCAGVDTSINATTDLAGDLIQINKDGASKIFGVTIRDCDIRFTVNQTAGAALHIGNVGQSFFENIRISAADGGRPFNGIVIDAGSQLFFDHVRVNGAVSRNLVIGPPNVTSATAIVDIWVTDSQFDDAQIDGVFIQNTSATLTVGGVYFTRLSVFNSVQSGVHINMGASVVTNDNGNFFFDDVILDSSGNSGLLVDGAGGFIDLRLFNVWASTNGDHGIFIANTVFDFEVVGGFALFNGLSGVVANGTEGKVQNVSIFDNNQDDTANFGLSVGGDLITVSGNRIYNTTRKVTNQNGLSIGAAASDVEVSNNYLDTGAGTTRYSNFGTRTRLRLNTHVNTTGGLTFATLGTEGNGSIEYCSDCTIANPCAGSGSGAMAKRINATWICN